MYNVINHGGTGGGVGVGREIYEKERSSTVKEHYSSETTYLVLLVHC